MTTCIIQEKVEPLWYKSDEKMDKPTIYRKPMGERLFEEVFTIEALSQMGNPLERLSSLVYFEIFRPVFEDVLIIKEYKTPAGRKPIDVVPMFKVIFLQRYYGLGDHQIQYQDNRPHQFPPISRHTYSG